MVRRRDFRASRRRPHRRATVARLETTRSPRRRAPGAASANTPAEEPSEGLLAVRVAGEEGHAHPDAIRARDELLHAPARGSAAAAESDRGGRSASAKAPCQRAMPEAARPRRASRGGRRRESRSPTPERRETCSRRRAQSTSASGRRLRAGNNDSERATRTRRRSSLRSRRDSARPNAWRSTRLPRDRSTKRRSSTPRSPPRTPTTPATRKPRGSSARRPGDRPMTPIPQGRQAHERETHPTVLRLAPRRRRARRLDPDRVDLDRGVRRERRLHAAPRDGVREQARRGQRATRRRSDPNDQCIFIPGNPKDCTGVLTCEFAVNRKYRADAELAVYTIGEQSQGCYLCAIPECISGELGYCEPVSRSVRPCLDLGRRGDSPYRHSRTPDRRSPRRGDHAHGRWREPCGK